jgi:hypothetical protein
MQCSDDNGNPLDGGVCVDVACYDPDDQTVVDLELGPTNEPACGAQIFFEWDTGCLSLISVDVDPDGELGWSQVFVNESVDGQGTWDLVLGTPIGASCDMANGANDGGTIARMTFDNTGICKCGGAFLRDHNPVSGINGANGLLMTTSCNGNTVVPGVNADSDPGNDGSQYSTTDEIQIQSVPQFACNGDDAGHADCGGITRTITVDAVTLTDDCDPLFFPLADLCTATYHQTCSGDLGCGFDPAELCATDAECDGRLGTCVADSSAKSFNCAGGLQCIGYCSQDTCSAGLCDSGETLVGAELDAILDGGEITLLPGTIDISCAYVNNCGRRAGCDYRLANDGLNLAVVDVELSPSMVPGLPADPIVRCTHFEFSTCGDPGDPHPIDAEVTFGAPDNIPGHGRAIVCLPGGNWDCVTAADPKHSLSSTCPLECRDDITGFEGIQVSYTQFIGSQNPNETCHWLVQGNLNYPSPNIDIFDFTVAAGLYLTVAPNGNDSLCGDSQTDADFNGDGLVTVADLIFIVNNFFSASKNPCEVVCEPGGGGLGVASTLADAPRSSATLDELAAHGLEESALVADANADGVVDLDDLAAFIDANDDDQLRSEQLRKQLERLKKSHRSTGRTAAVGRRK